MNQEDTSERRKPKIERLTFDNLIRNIANAFINSDPDFGISLFAKENTYWVGYTHNPSNTVFEAEGTSLFQAGKNLYRSLFDVAVLEVPMGLPNMATEKILQKLSSIKGSAVDIIPTRNGFDSVMWIHEAQAWARGSGLTIHHALVFMHRNIRELGIDLKL